MKKIIVIFLILLWAVTAGAAGSCTVTKYQYREDGQRLYTVYLFAWTSDASGDVSAGTGVATATITGAIGAVNFKSTSGAVPTNLYDVELLTADSENILSDGTTNSGANIVSALGSEEQRKVPFDAEGNFKHLYNETITPSISNAGNAKQGVIELIVY